MALYARTVSAALHKLGFNPVSKRSRFDGLTVSGKDRVRVAATWPDEAFAWQMIGECADALESAGWLVERSAAPRFPGLWVTGKAEKRETSMTNKETSAEIGDVAEGDLVTMQRSDATRTGRVTGIQQAGERVLLTLESVTVPGLIWTEWVTGDMIVTPAYGRVPTSDRPEPARDAVGTLRACMAQYLDGARDGRQSEQWHAARDGAGAMLHHLAMVTLGLSDEAATEWLAEELQEMLAARG